MQTRCTWSAHVACRRELGGILDEVNARGAGLHLDYSLDDPGNPAQIYERSDHYEYAKHGIPIAFFFTGVHGDYHGLEDEIEGIDFTKMRRIVQMIYATARTVADRLGSAQGRCRSPGHATRLADRAGPMALDMPKCTSRTNTLVLPFRIDLVPGVPVYEQLVAAVTRAVVCGELRNRRHVPVGSRAEPGASHQSQHGPEGRHAAHVARPAGGPPRHRHARGPAAAIVARPPAPPSSVRGRPTWSSRRDDGVCRCPTCTPCSTPSGNGSIHPHEVPAVAEPIVTHALGKAFGKIRALEDVSLRVPQGQVVGLIGVERRRQVDAAEGPRQPAATLVGPCRNSRPGLALAARVDLRAGRLHGRGPGPAGGAHG